MSDLGDILATRQFPPEPEEFTLIRQFVEERCQVTPKLQLRDQTIVITVPGSAAAGTLRFQLPELQEKLPDDCRVMIVSA